MPPISETSFLDKEWLVKTNPSSSTPYLFKFVSSTVDLTCSVLFTDTKSVWTEELTGQQLARRWRQLNPRSPPQFSTSEAEDSWRTSILQLLGKAHTLGGVNAHTFEVTDTHFSDIAFSLESVTFSWRWETNFTGHRTSADIISKQLVLPLISTNHLLFTSAEPIQVVADADVEKAVDKIGRSARRSVDTHIKNALSKPRVSTILRRITAVFNSLNELPQVISSVEENSLHVPSVVSRSPNDDYSAAISSNNLVSRDVEMSEAPVSHQTRSPVSVQITPPTQSTKPSISPAKAGSVTESSADEAEPNSSLAAPAALQSQNSQRPTPRRSASPKVPRTRLSASPKVESSHATPPHAKTHEATKGGYDQTSGDDSSPARPPPKRPKRVEADSSDSDSESERKAHLAQLKGAASGSSGAPKRAVRQPIKRGGKRF